MRKRHLIGRRSVLLLLCIGIVILERTNPAWGQRVAAKPEIAISDDLIAIHLDGQLFSRIHLREFAKPILYPLFAPGQIPMMRNWPMAEVAGEGRDHPHHKSLWLAHGDVNGIDFWSEKGTIRNASAAMLEGTTGGVELQNDWLHDEQPLIRETSRYRFSGDDATRVLDLDFTLQALAEPVRFGDTKEGFLAIRVHPGMRLELDRNSATGPATGTMHNSEQDKGNAVWGKRAAWVRYDGEVDGTPVAILFMDHPNSFRHPTPWHARGYGLFAANPFGLHDFGLGDQGAGDHTLQPGESLRFRYRLIFANLSVSSLDSTAAFESFAEGE